MLAGMSNNNYTTTATDAALPRTRARAHTHTPMLFYLRLLLPYFFSIRTCPPQNIKQAVTKRRMALTKFYTNINYVTFSRNVYFYFMISSCNRSGSRPGLSLPSPSPPLSLSLSCTPTTSPFPPPPPPLSGSRLGLSLPQWGFTPNQPLTLKVKRNQELLATSATADLSFSFASSWHSYTDSAPVSVGRYAYSKSTQRAWQPLCKLCKSAL